MIKMLSAYFDLSLVQVTPTDTPESLNQKAMIVSNDNFKFEIVETKTGRQLPRDEILLDNREYYAVFTILPSCLPAGG